MIVSHRNRQATFPPKPTAHTHLALPRSLLGRQMPQLSGGAAATYSAGHKYSMRTGAAVTAVVSTQQPVDVLRGPSTSRARGCLCTACQDVSVCWVGMHLLLSVGHQPDSTHIKKHSPCGCLAEARSRRTAARVHLGTCQPAVPVLLLPAAAGGHVVYCGGTVMLLLAVV